MWIARAPGRVNLLGEHVDYNCGPVLPTAIDRQVIIAAGPGEENTVTLKAIDLEEQTTFNLDSLEDKLDGSGSPLPNWGHYPAGVAWVALQDGLEVVGLQAVYTSNIPIGSGLSSSAAIEVGFALLWNALGKWDIDRMRLAQICQRAENEYVGVSSGLMDQFASLHGIKSHALYFDTRSLEWYPAPLPGEIELVIADTGVRRDLSESAYNARRAACEQAVKELRQYKPDIQSLRDISSTEFAAYSIFLSDEPRLRAEHVVKEIARVQSALRALERGDIQAIGALMYASHASLRDLYQVSTPELNILVELARDLPGTIGARLTGAGFGGCTINLVESEYVESFVKGLKEGYANSTGREPDVYVCQASQGASVRIAN